VGVGAGIAAARIAGGNADAADRVEKADLAVYGATPAGIAAAEEDRPAASEDEEVSESKSADAEQGEGWQPPEPPGAAERVEERHRMARRQVASVSAGRDAVDDPKVLEAMRTAPRHAFVPPRQRPRAYRDGPLPIGHGQTISQPYIVAKMTELLRLTPESKVLEIGTGSGYQAAVLGQLTPHVYTIEMLEPLAQRADRALQQQGYDHVEHRQGDGYFGWEKAAPFDAIIVTAAAGHVPPPLWKQLKPGGRMIMPIGGRFQVQRLTLLVKTEDGDRRTRAIMPVRFVPMTGRAEEGR
jgi:protein-L-isoaspartate(D-aspartate) O-methyltransferase